MNNKDFIQNLPKAELHIHIEGSLEPELMFELARRHAVNIPYTSIDDLKAAYNFTCLQDFLDIYYAGADVLRTKQDFYELTYAYLERVSQDKVRHVEVFFDPQTHTDRGIAFATVIEGISEALVQGEKDFGISYHIIMCFLRHLSEDAAFDTLKQALPYKQLILGVGLDSSEKGNPPAKFQKVFAAAKRVGFLAVAHAGEEGTHENIADAIALLNIDRIDHGNSITNSQSLQQEVKDKQLALTMCPLSNLKLQVSENLDNYPAKQLHDEGLIITINSDDPAYFGGYINDNYLALDNALKLSKRDLADFAINSFKGSFLSEDRKAALIDEVERYYNEQG